MQEDKNINISVVPQFVENVLDKPSKSIGDTFNDIWYLVWGGAIGYLAEKRKIKYNKSLEKYKTEIEEEIEAIPTEKRVEPDIQMIGQILEDSRYCIEKEELRRIFARLIAASINVEKKKYVHPMFSGVIRKMSELDAKLLYMFSVTSPKNIILSNTIDELSFSLVVLIELGIIIGTKNCDVRNYKFDHFSSLYYLLLKEYENSIDNNLGKKQIVSIKSYEINDVMFIHKFLWDEFRLTRFGQNLINTCIY